MTLAGHALLAALSAIVIVSIVLGNWTLALLHVHTVVLILVINDDLATRRRLRELEATVNELIEN